MFLHKKNLDPRGHRQKEKATEREWDKGKPPRMGDEEGRGMKRKYGSDEEDDRAHRRRQSFKPYDARKAPWVPQVDWDSCHNVAEMLHREVEAFVQYMSPTPVEDEIRGLVVQLVSNAITSAFPDARILPFGSYETKLYLPSGDIDLVIDSDSMARSNKVNVLHALANTLKCAGITSKVTVISKAKVPIVKFVTHFGRLNVDISVNQGNGVKAGRIINGFLQDMRGCGCIQKYAEVKSSQRRNLGVLVMEFFEFYGCYFNYEEVGISIRNGGSYFSKRRRGWYESYKGLLLSIEDPTDPTNDISKGSYGINKVRKTLAGAYGIMQVTAFLRAGILSSRREGRSYRLRVVTNPEDMSILSSILGVTQETINNRRLLQEVYEKRLLHKLLHASQGPVACKKSGMETCRSSLTTAPVKKLQRKEDPDESGKYDIQERRPTRLGGTNGTGRFDPLATYTTDEEDLSEDELEDLAYGTVGSDDDMRKGRVGRRRSYWLSKGIGPHDRDDEDGIAVGKAGIIMQVLTGAGDALSQLLLVRRRIEFSPFPSSFFSRGPSPRDWLSSCTAFDPLSFHNSNNPGWLSFLAGRLLNPSGRVFLGRDHGGIQRPNTPGEPQGTHSSSPATQRVAQHAPVLHRQLQEGSPTQARAGYGTKSQSLRKKEACLFHAGVSPMGTPQLAENAPPKKRGELYANRLPGLGRPSGATISRSGSPRPPTDESPAPRKRCISTGAALSSGPSNFSTDEPVPPLPNGLSCPAPRRNSLAINFGSGRRVMSTSDAEGVEFVDALSPSLSSLAPEKPPETTDSQPPNPESVIEPTLLEVEEPQPSSLEAPEVTLQPLEPPLVTEQSLPADSGVSKVDTPAEHPPAPQNLPFPVHDAYQNASQSPTIEQSSKDGLSDYESAPQSAVSQPSPSLPEPASSVPSLVPADTPSTPPEPTPTRAEIVVVSRSSSPPENVAKQVAASQGSAIATTAPNPTLPVPPSIPTPSLTTEARSQGKPTFKAVVHRKVTELPISPAASGLAPPATSQLIQKRRGVNSNVIDVPSSPGHGDLAVLLEDAALLELRLTEGDGTGLNAKELLAATPTNATFQPDLRHVSASTLTEHAPMPSIDSGSQSVRSVSIPSIRESFVDGDIPEGDETDGRSLASTTFSQRSPSHRKYLSNIYRLTSRRSSGYMPGTYPRDSMSMSSEDSSPVTTPSDNGKRKGFGIAWPSTSPKKIGSNVSRSSSFADKIFNRNRTKSNVSTADQVSERSSLYESSQPTLSLSFPSELSPETNPDGVDIGSRPESWISPGDSNSEFSPASSLLDKDIFDAFPSVPQTLPPGFHLDAENAGVGRTSTLPVTGRKQVNQRLSMA
ncbi:hypothetical protein J3R83DRAFT_4625 [Lanmaoa asiatica]|nr:hypothetical protein J3R83DRAFT_4625 [Lanmaoa asiatica]